MPRWQCGQVTAPTGANCGTTGKALEAVGVERANSGERGIVAMTRYSQMPHFGMHETSGRTGRHHCATDAGSNRDIGKRSQAAASTELPLGERSATDIDIQTHRNT